LEISDTEGGEGLGVYEESHRDVMHPQAYQVYRKVGFEMSLEGGTGGSRLEGGTGGSRLEISDTAG